jgi:hypothetical protein
MQEGYQFAIYEVNTGKILSTIDNLASEKNIKDYVSLVEDMNSATSIYTGGKVDFICSGNYSDLCPDKYYVENNAKILPKQPFPFLDTKTNGIINGIPLETVVMWPDLIETVESTGSLEFESNVSGIFEFVFNHQLYLTKTIELEYYV